MAEGASTPGDLRQTVPARIHALALVLAFLGVVAGLGAGPAVAQRADDAFAHSMRRGVAALDAGEPEAAAEAFREALRARPDDPEARAFLGTALLQQGSAAAAAEQLEAAARALPEHDPARVDLASAYLALGREDAAIPELRVAVRLEPEDSATRARLTTILLRRDRLEEAAEHARELTRRLPEQATVHSLLGIIELRRGRDAEALASFDAALALDPDAVDARYGRAAALHALDRDDEALSLVATLVEDAPEHADAWTLLADLFAEGEDAESRIAAVGAYRRALTLRPDDPRLLLSLTRLFREAGLNREAMELLEGSDASREDPRLALLLGRMLFERERLDDARDLYERATEVGGGAEAWYRLGVVSVNLADLETAERAYRRSLELDPDHVGALRELGDVLLDRGRADEAAEVLERALERVPDDDRTWYLAGLAALRGGDAPRAVERLRRAARLDPDNADAHYNLGLALRRAGDAEAAAAALDEARRLRQAAEGEPEPEPRERGEALVRAGYLRYRIGSLERAARMLRRATELLPDEEEPWLYLGLTLAAGDQVDEAVAALERAAEIRPGRAETWEALARLYERTGRREDAGRARDRAAEIRDRTGSG